MACRRLDRFGAKRNPRRYDRGAFYRDSNNVVCRNACVAMGLAARFVHYWNCGDGWYRSSSAQLISLPGDLDVAALDPCYRVSIADTVGRIDSNERRDPPISTHIKCSAMGGHAFPDVVVGGFSALVRGGSKPGDGHLLWRPDIRRDCDATTHLLLGTRAAGARLCDGVHYLLDRSVYRMSDPQVRAAAAGLVGSAARSSRRKQISQFALILVLALISVCSLHAQTGTPATRQQPPRAIYTPRPVYRPEWAKQGLTGKGVVLVTIDQQTGMVTGARMLQSTGNKQLDGAALEAYSQWRFQPGSGSQVKIPIEFKSRPKPQTANRALPKPAILYPLLILIGFAVAVMAMRTRRK